MTTEFPNTNTRGFASTSEPKVAVCLLPGTEIAFEREVRRVLTGFRMIFSKKAREPIADKVARFRQVDTDHPHVHHDALEFPDGRVVLVTHLRPGQQATVLQLPAHPTTLHVEMEKGDNQRIIEYTGRE